MPRKGRPPADNDGLRYGHRAGQPGRLAPDVVVVKFDPETCNLLDAATRAWGIKEKPRE